MAARLSANMAITAIILTPVPPMASTGPTGSRAAFLSAQAPGIADIGGAATMVAAGVDTAGVTGDSIAVATDMAAATGTAVATDTDMAEEPVAAGTPEGSTVAIPFTAVAASIVVAEAFTAVAGLDTAVVVTANHF